MAGKRKGLSVRKLKEMLRLSLECGLERREIARSLSVSHTTVNGYVGRAEELGLSQARVEEMSEEELECLLRREEAGGSGSSSFDFARDKPRPDWDGVHRELRKKGVTLQLLWQEYKEVHPEGYQLSQFYELYRQWKKKLSLSMRQDHRAGEKLFVDYAGQTVPVVDPVTGGNREAQVFVGVLGASNYTFAEAVGDQSLSSWIGSHVRAFEYFGGVPRVVVPDNLKSGVSRACRYEPDLNPTYHDLAVHYGTVIFPARVRKPKDKAKVEVGVQVVERWLLAALRNRTFFSLEELNRAIRELLEKLNRRPFKKLPGSRLSWFLEMEKPALRPLPSVRYVLAEWKKALVNIDYHVEFNRHYYSVPYRLVQEEVEIRATAQTVEVYFRGRRVASHLRDDSPGRHSTLKEHMPKSHQEYLDWTPSRMIQWAGQVGCACAQVVETILNSRAYPEQGYRSCLGILRLEKSYSPERLEAACRRALAIRGCSYKSIKSILEKGLDQKPLGTSTLSPPREHENVRGENYYH